MGRTNLRWIASFTLFNVAITQQYLTLYGKGKADVQDVWL